MTKVFISYARADGKHAATRLHSELELAGISVYQDVRDLESGDWPWQDQISTAIWNSDVVVVLLSPRANASDNCKWEWDKARGKRIILVRVVQCDLPSEFKG